jgi:transcriptional regulator with XRE-family HTH domain
LAPSVWGWLDPASRTALRSGDLGEILRAHRRINHLSQEKLAAILGYDTSYISLIETGRRPAADVATRRHIARRLAIPAHLLGVTDPADTEYLAMIAFAKATVRLAELARAAGRAAEAVNELWAVVARLEARAAEGHLEQQALAVLAEAWISLGVCLGTVLPEERLWVATRWTARGLTAAGHLPDLPQLKARALQMHGNELRKAGHHAVAITVLQQAAESAPAVRDRAAALALLARAAGDAGNRPLFVDTCGAYQAATDAHTPQGPLCNPFVWREIRLRGLHAIGDQVAAERFAHLAVTDPAPTPQWNVIERITTADVLTEAGAHDQAETLLLPALNGARLHRLPHQVQRVQRIARRARNRPLAEQASLALNALIVSSTADPG